MIVHSFSGSRFAALSEL